MACGISLSQPGIQPVPLAVEALSLSHWRARKPCIPVSVELMGAHGLYKGFAKFTKQASDETRIQTQVCLTPKMEDPIEQVVL